MNMISRSQAPKFCALVIMIYYYHNLDLAVIITKNIQYVFDKQKKKKKKKENNILLKTEDPREKKS